MKLLSYRLCIACACLALGQIVAAQQTPQFTQHRFNELFYNPAYAGNSTDIYIESVFRGQWLGIEGQPLTVGLGVHTALPRWNSGAGINIINEMLGAERHTAVYFQYNYRKNFKQNGQLSIGLEAGALQKSLDGTRLITPGGTYEGGINHNDQVLSNTTQSGLGFDLGLGARYQTKKFVLGIAANHLLSTPIKLGDAKINLVPHTIIYTHYRFIISNSIDFEPAVLLKTDFKKFQSDITLTTYFGDNWLGAIALRGIGTWESISATVSSQISPQWRIGYSYDYVLSPLKSATSGSHELTLQCRLKNNYKGKQGKKTFSPRFL